MMIGNVVGATIALREKAAVTQSDTADGGLAFVRGHPDECRRREIVCGGMQEAEDPGEGTLGRGCPPSAALHPYRHQQAVDTEHSARQSAREGLKKSPRLSAWHIADPGGRPPAGYCNDLAFPVKYHKRPSQSAKVMVTVVNGGSVGVNGPDNAARPISRGNNPLEGLFSGRGGNEMKEGGK